ncbi:MAG: hypothetical protein GDA47_02945, partial [Rhodospirillales bacterium]|nr:hypothetical protein [Rhodospirillales bacterium]
MRKKSIRKVTQAFRSNVDGILAFTQRLKKAGPALDDRDEEWCHELAIVRLHRECEELMLACLVTAINHDPASFSNHK